MIGPDDLRPLVETVVSEMLTRFSPGDRLAWPEAEAAALIGVKSHVLRDARLRGEITGAKLGRGWSYTRPDLLKFIESRRNGGQE
jgi:hypothetical protein